MLKVPNAGQYIWAHSAWKTHLRKAIESGQSEFTVSDTCKDNHCELGKWLYALPASQQVSAEWNKLRAMHAEFHHEAGRVLKLALAGQAQEAEQAMSIGSPFSKVSSGLVMFLSELQ